MKEGINILICPLEWGLGHAARMIPIARKLLELNNNVFIGAGEKHLALFRVEMPDLRLISFPGFSPGYSRYLPQYIFLLLKTPLLLYHIIAEHYRLKKIVRDYKIGIVISDNRFGLWDRNITSVYVTHMLRIPLPKHLRLLESIGMTLHRYVIKNYSLCFIPDLPGDLNISGRLSHGIKMPGNARYIGLLSRFTSGNTKQINPFDYPHNTVILSGPEPQRSILKQKLTKALSQKEPPTVMLEGKPGKDESSEKKGNIIFYNHLPSGKMKALIESGNYIISRSGYTTIMDLVSLGRTALLIPTPGQTEQEYLAEYLVEKGWFETINQDAISDEIILTAKDKTWPGDMMEKSKILLDNALSELLEEHNK